MARTMLQERLLTVAIEQFGHYGFDGASTRDIARASDTAMSSITYHFGGKEGLYLAAAEHVARNIASFQAPLCDKAASQAATADRTEATALFLDILENFTELMLRPESENWALFIVREQQQPSEAFRRIYSGCMEKIIDTGLLLLSRARPDLDDNERRALGIMLFGQALVLRICRASVQRIMGCQAIGDRESQLLRRQIRNNARCILLEESDG